MNAFAFVYPGLEVRALNLFYIFTRNTIFISVGAVWLCVFQVLYKLKTKFF